MSHAKTIGETNGMWAWFFKLNQLLVPIVCLFVGWSINENSNRREEIAELREWRAQMEGNRFTDQDAYAMEVRWNEKLGSLPPEAFVKRMELLEGENAGLHTDISEMKVTLMRIETLLVQHIKGHKQ